MNRKRELSWKRLVLSSAALLLLGNVFASQTTLSLSTDKRFFAINGQETRLLGISYFAPLDLAVELASNLNLLREDLDKLKSSGFNAIRVWASWYDVYHKKNLSVITKNGLAVRQPYMSRLKVLLSECDARGIIVDVTICRLNDEACPKDQTQHLNWVKRLTTQLKTYRNAYFDLANEFITKKGQDLDVKWPELKALIKAVHAIDSSRLCSASLGKVLPSDISPAPNKPSEFDNFVAVNLDFALLHGLYPNSLTLRQMLQAHNIVIPICMNETPRRFSPYFTNPCYTSLEFWQQLQGADNHGQGVAGWFLHNGMAPNPTVPDTVYLTDECGPYTSRPDVIGCLTDECGPYKCFYMNEKVGLLLSGGRDQFPFYTPGQLESMERNFIYVYGPKYRGW